MTPTTNDLTRGLTASECQVTVDLGDRCYDILIGDGLLSNPRALAGLPGGGHALVVTNTVVGPLYAETLKQLISPLHRSVSILELPDGEAHKNWESMDQIFTALLQGHADRHTVLYALGGGVVGDMTGFAAACYMRGIAFVQVPTTLLSQVDSSVGGKTAINHPLGKNMVGAFYQPLRVLADLATLRTLPPREVSAGLAEVIKYGAILDAGFLSWLGRHMAGLRALDGPLLAEAVRRSCEFKAQVVAADERESGVRAHLNFGHTFAHAIEAGMGYGQWLHGEAVGVGMVMAAHLSAHLGLLDLVQVASLKALIASAGLPVKGPALDAHACLALMRHDKKAAGGQIRFVVLEAPGKAVMRTAPDEMVISVLRCYGAS